jgi:uncharacterized protein (TIGR02147 family)
MDNEKLLQEPDIFHYTNYRLYLKDYFQFKKSQNPKFSFRMFARKAGFSSHSILQFLFEGKRNLSKKSVLKLIQGMNMGKKKAEFFEALVFFNQSKTREEKNIFYEQLLKIVPRNNVNRLQGDQFQIFKKWYISVIREMVNLRNFNDNAQWIADNVNGAVSVGEVKEAFELLGKSGMIKKTPGGYALVDKNLTTDDEVNPLLIKNYHYEMIRMAIQAMDKIPGSQRDISSASFSIKKEDFDRLKKHIQLMRKELFQFQAKEGEGDLVIQVNLQLFPLTQGT